MGKTLEDKAEEVFSDVNKRIFCLQCPACIGYRITSTCDVETMIKSLSKEDTPVEGYQNIELILSSNYCERNLIEDLLAEKSKLDDIFDSGNGNIYQCARFAVFPQDIKGSILSKTRSGDKLRQISEWIQELKGESLVELLLKGASPENPAFFLDLCAGPGDWSEWLLRETNSFQANEENEFISKKCTDFNEERQKSKSLCFGFGISHTVTDLQRCEYSADWCIRNCLLKCKNFREVRASDGSGNIYCSAALSSMKGTIISESRKRRKIQNKLNTDDVISLVVADGGITIQKDARTGSHLENFQELLCGRLLLSELLFALEVLRHGGTFICTIFDSFSSFTASFLYLCSSLFEEIYIVKPLRNRSGNSERQLICVDFRKLDSSQIVETASSGLDTKMPLGARSIYGQTVENIIQGRNTAQEYRPRRLSPLFQAVRKKLRHYHALLCKNHGTDAVECNLPRSLISPHIMRKDFLFEETMTRCVTECCKHQISSLKMTFSKFQHFVTDKSDLEKTEQEMARMKSFMHKLKKQILPREGIIDSISRNTTAPVTPNSALEHKINDSDPSPPTKSNYYKRPPLEPYNAKKESKLKKIHVCLKNDMKKWQEHERKHCYWKRLSEMEKPWRQKHVSPKNLSPLLSPTSHHLDENDQKLSKMSPSNFMRKFSRDRRNRKGRNSENRIKRFQMRQFSPENKNWRCREKNSNEKVSPEQKLSEKRVLKEWDDNIPVHTKSKNCQQSIQDSSVLLEFCSQNERKGVACQDLKRNTLRFWPAEEDPFYPTYEEALESLKIADELVKMAAGGSLEKKPDCGKERILRIYNGSQHVIADFTASDNKFLAAESPGRASYTDCIDSLLRMSLSELSTTSSKILNAPAGVLPQLLFHEEKERNKSSATNLSSECVVANETIFENGEHSSDHTKLRSFATKGCFCEWEEIPSQCSDYQSRSNISTPSTGKTCFHGRSSMDDSVSQEQEYLLCNFDEYWKAFSTDEKHNG